MSAARHDQAPSHHDGDDAERIRKAQFAHTASELTVPIDAILRHLAELAAGVPAASSAASSATSSALADLDKMRSATSTFQRLLEVVLRQAETDGLNLPCVLRHLPRRTRHDLRTPLAHLIGYAELLLEEASDDADAEFAARTRRVLGLGRCLLDTFSRLTTPDADDAADDPDSSEHMIADVIHAFGAHAGDAAAAADRAPGRILVADDNVVNRDLLEQQLTREGHEVVLVEDGAAALGRLAEGPVDVVLLDIIMPRMNGFEVLQRMRAEATLRHVPVIMLSAMDEVAGVARCIEVGAEDYITKPIDWSLLRARIGSALEKKRLRDREHLHLQRIEDEQRRSEALLRVILPEQVIAELKAQHKVVPRRHDAVAVLFSDIVSFTDYCDRRDPEEVLGQLQDLVQAFEDLVARHRMHKVKTIGDAFMATAGLLLPLDNPVRSAVEMGCDMLRVMADIAPQWSIRVGIHVGPVVAGILGRQQFQFDLWGDTVNTASRMVGAADPGSIALTAEAWSCIADVARADARGPVDIKGKGALDVFLFRAFHEVRAPTEPS